MLFVVDAFLCLSPRSTRSARRGEKRRALADITGMRRAINPGRRPQRAFATGGRGVSCHVGCVARAYTQRKGVRVVLPKGFEPGEIPGLDQGVGLDLYGPEPVRGFQDNIYLGPVRGSPVKHADRSSRVLNETKQLQNDEMLEQAPVLIRSLCAGERGPAIDGIDHAEIEEVILGVHDKALSRTLEERLQFKGDKRVLEDLIVASYRLAADSRVSRNGGEVSGLSALDRRGRRFSSRKGCRTFLKT